MAKGPDEYSRVRQGEQRRPWVCGEGQYSGLVEIRVLRRTHGARLAKTLMWQGNPRVLEIRKDLRLVRISVALAEANLACLLWGESRSWVNCRLLGGSKT